MKVKETPVVKFSNVCRYYGSTGSGGEVVKALCGVSFEITKGEFLAVTGPSGSGKSTLLHLMGLLDRPSEGEIDIDGVPVSKMSDTSLAKLRNQKIGFIFQQFNLLPKTSSLKQVELPLVYAGVPAGKRREMAKKELEAVGLADKMNNRPSQLSGGQQQRVAIARAMVTGPALLLADEPTGNLDSKSGASILELFEQLHEGGVTVIIVTHDRDVAAHAPRQLVIRDGELVEDQPTRRLRPASK